MGDGSAALGEGGRIEHDKVERSALLAQPAAVAPQLGKVVEDVGAREAHAVGEAVQARVLLGEVKGGLAHVDAAYEVGAARGGVHAEGANVAEAIEHATPVREAPHGAAIVLLVEEEAGLLAVLDVDGEREAVLAHGDDGRARRGRPVPPALVERKPLLGARRRVVALVDGAHVLSAVSKRLEQERVDGVAQALHAHGADLCHQDMLVAVDHEAGHAVRLREDHAAAGEVALGAREPAPSQAADAMLPRPAHAALPEPLVDKVVGVAGHQADANLALL